MEEASMEKPIRVAVAFCVLAAAVLLSAQAKPGLLTPDEVKKAVPSVYFFRGQSAPVQVRNTSGFRVQDDKLVMIGLVDTSGYASDVQAKYQGFLITEVKLDIEGKELAPGQYGFGISKDGKFLVMDVGADDLFTVSAHADDGMTHPVPLKIAADGGGYRLYAGKKWVGLKVK
jgi:hypothetical protein